MDMETPPIKNGVHCISRDPASQSPQLFVAAAGLAYRAATADEGETGLDHVARHPLAVAPPPGGPDGALKVMAFLFELLGQLALAVGLSLMLLRLAGR